MSMSKDWFLPLGLHFLNGILRTLSPSQPRSSSVSEDFVLFNWKESTDRTLHWVVTVYKYCTGAVPTDPDFIKKGGQYVLILVHRGTLFTSEPNWNHQVFSVTSRPSSDSESGERPELYRCYPMSYTGVSNPNGSVRYDVDVQMALPLYKNRGHESFLFNAQYRECFVRAPTTEHFGDNQSGDHTFVIAKNQDKIPADLPPPEYHCIRGVTIFKGTDLSKPVKLKFSQESDSLRTESSYEVIEIKLNDF